MKTAIAIALGALWLCGCDDAQSSAADELTIVVRGDRRELELQENALAQRESALKAEQVSLEKRIDELAKNRSAADSEELARARAMQREMAAKVESLQAQRNEVGAKKSALEPGEGAVQSTALAVREAKVGTREAKVAEREAEAARKEKELNDRERALGLHEGGGAAQQDSSGREVPKAAAIAQKHQKILEDLKARGLLIADLPLEAQPLNAEIFQARRQGDFSRASDLVTDLGKAAGQVRVDQKFIDQKMVRLQGFLRSGSKVSETQKREVERLLHDVTAAFSDGKFDTANRGLNRIADILDASGSSG